MGQVDLPPRVMYDASPIAPIELPGGSDVALGRMVVPFGDRTSLADRGAFRRMADAEQAVVRQGLPLSGPATGVAARLRGEEGDPWALDAALVVARDVGVEQLARRGPMAPDLATRGSWRGGGVEVGASAWLGSLGVEDHAYGADVSVDAGRWTLGTAWAHQRIGAVKDVFDGELTAKSVVGERATVRLVRVLHPHWSVSTLVESQVFLVRDQLALSPWARGAVGLAYDLRRSVRWTVLEVADLVTLDPSEDCRRVSTRIELR